MIFIIFIFVLIMIWSITDSLIIGGFLMLSVVAAKFFVTIPGYSEGTRIVTVEKVSKKSILFKTYEGTGVLGVGSNSDGEMVRKLWYFSVKDSKVALQLDSLSGSKVKLYYNQNYLTCYNEGNTSYIVYKGERIK